MSLTLIGTVCSRLRGVLKAYSQDTWLTDKYLYSLYRKYAAVVMARLDEKGKLTKFSSVFETLDFVELEECDKIEAGCSGIRSYATFRKTKLPMPMFTEGTNGPMVNSITSLDGSTTCQLIRNIDIFNYIAKDKNFKYNTTKYCWYLNDRLYFGNVDWLACRIEGIFEEDISAFKCCGGEEFCLPRQEQSLNIPDKLLADIENLILEKDFRITLAIPSDTINDKNSITR